MIPLAVAHVVKDQLPGRRRLARQAQRENEQFDREHGVQTARNVLLSDLDLDGSRWANGNTYAPISTGTFRHMMRSLPIRFEDYTFIDFGSGKGKAVMLATEHPFRRVVGVELAAELHRLAEQNLSVFTSEKRACWEVELLNVDALEYELPPEPSVLFFYNPFDEQVMAPLVQRVGRSLECFPRPLWVMYETPRHAELWDRSGFLTRVADTGAYITWANAQAMDAPTS